MRTGPPTRAPTPTAAAPSAMGDSPALIKAAAGRIRYCCTSGTIATEIRVLQPASTRGAAGSGGPQLLRPSPVIGSFRPPTTDGDATPSPTPLTRASTSRTSPLVPLRP